MNKKKYTFEEITKDVKPEDIQAIRDQLEYYRAEECTCLHDKCSECKGTGFKKDKTPCVHYISCNCNKCKATYL